MPFPRKDTRNDEIVHDRDKKKMTFTTIGEKFGIKRHTAYEVYERTKIRIKKEKHELYKKKDRERRRLKKIFHKQNLTNVRQG